MAISIWPASVFLGFVFSAGGHLAAAADNNYRTRSDQPARRCGGRRQVPPDFSAVLVYPLI